MRIAICEDNRADMDKLVGYCEQYAAEHSVHLEMLQYENTDALLSDVQVLDAGALIMDIQMDTGTSGMDAAHILRKQGYSGALLFVTVTKDFYADGFQLGALHYLIKPVSYADFSEGMSRIARAMGAFERYITVTSLRKQIQIPLRHIFYVEVKRHSTILHTTAGPVPVSASLAEIERLLSDPRFLKCYRSCMVNMDKVAKVMESDFLLKNDMHVPITKRQNAQIKDRYMRYIFAGDDK